MNRVSTPVGTILVVDDADGIRLTFANWLRRAGHTVLEAATGGEALEVVARNSVDLVILDVHLPDMSGFDVRNRIKANRTTAGVPILHVSATATQPSDRSFALNTGADGYLFEPVEREELIATANSLLRYHEARRAVERMVARLERLHQATLLMNAASTVTELLQFACTGLISVFGVPAAVMLSIDDSGRIAAAQRDRLEPTVSDFPVAEILEVARRVAAGEPPQLDHLANLIAEAPYGAVGSAISTPLGERVGATLLFQPEAAPDDVLMLDQFAQALAVALEKQRLYAVEHTIALTLQRAMLPTSIPQRDHLQVAVRYLAASDTAEIGGDFYEALAISDDCTLLAVGDVVGHSLQAATVMAELRHSLRAFASIGMPASEILGRLDRMLQESHPGMTATMCIAEVDRAGTVTITNAGHLPPVISDANGVRTIATHGPLLGLRHAPPVPAAREPFPPGATLVLITDGLIERRDEDLLVGLERLTSCLSDAPDDAEQLCDVLLAKVGPSDGGSDDIAMIAARRVP